MAIIPWGVEDFLVLAHFDLQSAPDDEVKLLTGVGGGVDGLILQLLGILVGDPVGGGQLLAEHGRQVLDGDTVLAGGDQALVLPGDGIARQLGAAALQPQGDLNAENLGALMHKGERQVRRTGLLELVAFLGNLGQLRHLLHAVAQQLTHVPNSGRHLHQLCCRVLAAHKIIPFIVKSK